MLKLIRTFKTKTSPLVISEEIKQALNDKKPIVSLESTILTHGFPYPENLSLGLEFEDIVRSNGGVPATIAFIKGVPHVGLSSDQISYLTENCKSAVKVSRRDIGHVMANKLNGATTIASTSILSSLAGISVFGTGGLGGVHREGQITMDISNDLVELGRNPITVVCAGPKSILDIGLTMEYLETQGVYVTTYNDDGSDKVEIPGFYARKSGVKSPNQFTNFKDVADVIYNQQLLGLESGNLVCIPPPKDIAMDSDFINKIIEDANEEAKEKGIKGKDITPFLLLKIGEMTKGQSLVSNREFVKNNIKYATEIAKNLSSLEYSSLQPVDVSSQSEIPTDEKSVETESITKEVDTIVVGSVALDTISKLDTYHMNDSNPGSTRTSIGGVGHNVSLATHYTGGKIRFVSIIGDDLTGKSLKNMIEVDNTLFEKPGSTASYTSIHDTTGELVIACADMKIIETDFSHDIIQELDRYKPKNVVLDCNLSVDTLQKVINHASCNVVIEPTSVVKSKRIGELELNVHESIELITPTINELESIYETLESREMFDDEWFEVIDSLELYRIRDILQGGMIKKLYDQGIVQKAFKLIPFFNNIIIKLGKEGVLCIGNTQSKFLQTKSQFPFYIEYHPIPEQNKNLQIVNVTGAGDTFLGALMSNLHLPLKEAIHKSQLCSGLSITSEDAINSQIRDV